MILLKDDTINGIRFMSYEDSKKTGRVYKRVDKNGKLEPYYEYRDTAMSRLCLFKPEWISQLRVVSNNKPDNPDLKEKVDKAFAAPGCDSRVQTPN